MARLPEHNYLPLETSQLDIRLSKFSKFFNSLLGFYLLIILIIWANSTVAQFAIKPGKINLVDHIDRKLIHALTNDAANIITLFDVNENKLAKVGSDSMNQVDANLAMVTKPPIWNTWWVNLLYVFMFLGLLYLLRRYELNRLKLKLDLEINQVEAEKRSEIDIEKNKFFSNISHEFRTPLTLILGPLERIIDDQKNNEQQQELLLIRRNAQRLQTLINQLLSLSKLESGKMKLHTRPQNIVQLGHVFVRSFESLAKEQEIKLEFASDAEKHIVYIDALKFEKIANNLISNAMKFTERGGKIKVAIRKAVIGEGQDLKEGVNILISDTGIGIRKEKLPHIFDRFYQVDEEQMKTYLGTGIGLALTKELIELHHGSISADSEAGIGTTFTIFLQSGKEHLSDDEIISLAPNEPGMDDYILIDNYSDIHNVSSNEALSTDIDNNNQPLLLIVEDNDDMRTYIKSYLLGDYNIIEANDGRDGAEKAIKHLPDLILSDLMMPFVDGNEMTIMLKNDVRTSHIPIILLTAKASRESKLEGLETGADDFLTKPFDAYELKIRVKNLIEQRRKLRELLAEHIGDSKETNLIYQSPCSGMSKMDEEFLDKATNIIEVQIDNPDFSVEFFAKEMAVSRVQLHRKLKSLTNHSASDMIRNIRLKKACELLKEGDLNVTQVSYEVGISSLSYFAKAFKEKYGVSPSSFNNSVTNKH